MDAWAIEHKLSRKTTGILRKDECDKVESLRLLTSSDVNRMDIPIGQLRLFRLALRALGNPIKVDDLAEEKGRGSVAEPLEEEQGAGGGEVIPDVNEQILDEAGDHLAQLLRQDPQEEAPGQAAATEMTKPVALPKRAVRTMTYAQYDPLMHLTVKSSKRKALQIEQFLPEQVRARVNRKKKEQLTFTTTPLGGLTLKKDEPGTIYVTVAEWNGANMRLCSHMLKNGLIKESELIYYMAYTAMIADLTGRYEWASVLEYDVRYRELQAEHNFLWGTPHPHTEMHMLTPRRVDHQGKNKVPVSSSRPQEKPRQKVDIPCRKWLARRECDFGENCIYRHDKPGASSDKTTTPKND